MCSSSGRDDGRSYVDLSLCTRSMFICDCEVFLGVMQLNQIRSLLRNSVHGSLQMRRGTHGNDRGVNNTKLLRPIHPQIAANTPSVPRRKMPWRYKHQPRSLKFFEVQHYPEQVLKCPWPQLTFLWTTDPTTSSSATLS